MPLPPVKTSIFTPFDNPSLFSRNPLIPKYNTNIVHATYVCTTRGSDNWRRSVSVTDIYKAIRGCGEGAYKDGVDRGSG